MTLLWILPAIVGLLFVAELVATFRELGRTRVRDR